MRQQKSADLSARIRISDTRPAHNKSVAVSSFVTHASIVTSYLTSSQYFLFSFFTGKKKEKERKSLFVRRTPATEPAFSDRSWKKEGPSRGSSSIHTPLWTRKQQLSTTPSGHHVLLYNTNKRNSTLSQELIYLGRWLINHTTETPRHFPADIPKACYYLLPVHGLIKAVLRKLTFLLRIF